MEDGEIQFPLRKSQNSFYHFFVCIIIFMISLPGRNLVYLGKSFAHKQDVGDEEEERKRQKKFFISIKNIFSRNFQLANILNYCEKGFKTRVTAKRISSMATEQKIFQRILKFVLKCFCRLFLELKFETVRCLLKMCSTFAFNSKFWKINSV